jgi:hypothetical protein
MIYASLLIAAGASSFGLIQMNQYKAQRFHEHLKKTINE